MKTIACDFYHRPGDGRVPELVRAEEGSASGHFHCRDDTRHVDDKEEVNH